MRAKDKSPVLVTLHSSARSSGRSTRRYGVTVSELYPRTIDRDGLWNEVLEVLRAGPSLPSRRASTEARTEAAEIRNRTAWQRVVWAIDGLHALLLLRAELHERGSALTREIEEAGGLPAAPVELLDELALRQTQVREVLAAFLSQGKVLLDLLSQAVVAALGEPRSFRPTHGSFGVKLDEAANVLGVAPPGDDLVERARELDRRVADVRDDLIVHPRLAGEHRRAYVHPAGDDLVIGTLFPDEDTADEASIIHIGALDRELEAYTRDLARWVVSVLAAA